MEAFRICGGKRLNGSLVVPTAKNAILPILAASIISNGMVVIEKCSKFSDIINMTEILDHIGAKNTFDGDTLHIQAQLTDKNYIGEEFTKKVRSSIFMLGPLLTKFRKATVAYPGGCNIGNRPIDLHLKGLRSLNVKIEEKHGYIYCDGTNMKAGEIHLDFPSVGATENLMLASVMLKGKTTIYNSAKEPEITDLQNFLNAMGCKVSGGGTSTIVVQGVKNVKGCVYRPISDRIITGTYMIACAMTGGKCAFSNTNREHNLALIDKLKQAGVKVSVKNNTIVVNANGKPKSIANIETLPYPGFPTDLQSQILTLQTISKGTSVITENLFETRFKIVDQLTKMGADITIKNRMAIVKGVPKLYGASVVANDLRGGAGLAIAGLSADGYTIVEDVEHIDRGYQNMENDLAMLGADIKRIKL